MRHCASCNREDTLYYDAGQLCECRRANGLPLDAVHDWRKHSAHCPRIRHTVTWYRKRLRAFRQTDDISLKQENQLPDEYPYLRQNAFTGIQHSGFLWAQKLLCRDCVIEWEQRQELRRSYEAACAAKTTEHEPSYAAALFF